MAQVANLFIRAELEDNHKNNNNHYIWYEQLKNKSLTLKGVTFAAPMALINPDKLGLDENENVNTSMKSLMKNVVENSCNIVFGPDDVTRGSSQIFFFNYILNAISPELINDELKPAENGFWGRMFVPLVSGLFRGKLSKEEIKALKGSTTPLIPAMLKFLHYSTLLYYDGKEYADTPCVLQDSGPNGGEGHQFSQITFTTYEKDINKGKYLEPFGLHIVTSRLICAPSFCRATRTMHNYVGKRMAMIDSCL